MKKVIAILLACIIVISGCSSQGTATENSIVSGVELSQEERSGWLESEEWAPDTDISFSGMNDEELLPYMEDCVYMGLIKEVDSADFFVENVSAIYISQEYMEEVACNSKSNIFFGYTLAELNQQFQGTRYVFTVSDTGETKVQEFVEIQDDTYSQILRNVAVGSGVILICVTVSAVSGGLGAPAVSMVFAVAAKSGTVVGLSSGIVSGIAAGIIEGYQTGDFEEALEAGLHVGSEGFKWGVISGAISGGTDEAIGLYGAAKNGLTMNEAALIQKESQYPLDVIKQFQSMEQYEICKSAGLTSYQVNGKTALIRKIDVDYVDEYGRTNLQRMLKGDAPLDPTGVAYELHHVGQKNDSTLAILTKAEHRLGDNHKIWHYIGETTDNPSSQANWGNIKSAFWKEMAKLLGGVK